jgi:hypothetical protein
MKRLALSWMVFVVLWGTGCSYAPVELPYFLQFQSQLQAARHWDELANDVAVETAKLLGERTEDRIVSVAKMDDTKFGEAFYELLLTRLVQNKAAVANGPNAANVLKYETVLVEHKASGSRPAHVEVILTSTLYKNSFIIGRLSRVYYIQDPDTWHYYAKKVPVQPVKTYTMKAE